VEFCGNSTPHEFYSTGSTVRITFISDTSVVRSGEEGVGVLLFFIQIHLWLDQVTGGVLLYFI
jgi:hypothetical protein